jgi:hypothetical protein
MLPTVELVEADVHDPAQLLALMSGDNLASMRVPNVAACRVWPNSASCRLRWPT